MTSNIANTTSNSILTTQEKAIKKNLENNTNSILPPLSSIENAEERKRFFLENYGGPNTKDTPTGLRGLRCSECGKFEAFTLAYDPVKAHLVVECERKNKCGCRKTYQELCPQKSFPKQYKKTFGTNIQVPAHHMATSWLEFRNIPKNLIHTVLKPGVDYYQDKKNGRDAIFFPLENKSKNIRFLDDQSPKNHNEGSSRTYYKIQGFSYDSSRPVYVTESPLKTMALTSQGLQSVAFTSANISAENDLFKHFKDFILCAAFDNDKAGIKATKAFNKQLEELGLQQGLAILPPPGKDWDELLPFIKTREDFRIKHLREYEAYGELALVENAQEYVETYQRHEDVLKHPLPKIFTFKGNTYFWEKVRNKETKENEVKVSLAYRAVGKHEYSLEKENEDIKTTYTFVLRFDFPDGTSKTAEFTAEDFTDNRFGSALQEKAHIVLQAKKRLVHEIRTSILNERCRKVKELNYSGMHRESGYYLRPDYGISKTGELIFPNELGCFKIEEKFLKPKRSSLLLELHENFQFLSKEERAEIRNKEIKDLICIYGTNGKVALTHRIAALRQQDMKDRLIGVPFLALDGSKNTGKTSLITTISFYMGISANVPSPLTSTTAYQGRAMSQLSGGWEWVDELNKSTSKSRMEKIEAWLSEVLQRFLSDGGRGKGARNSSNDTIIDPNLAVPVIGYNHRPTNEIAFLSRLIVLKTTEKGFSNDQRKLADEIKKRINHESQLVGISILEAILPIEKARWFNEIEQAKADLYVLKQGEIDSRIQSNISVIVGVNRLLAEVTGIQELALTENEIERLVEVQEKELDIYGTSQVLIDFMDVLAQEEAINLNGELRGREQGYFHRWIGEHLFFYLKGYFDNNPNQRTLNKKELEVELDALEVEISKQRLNNRVTSGRLISKNLLQTLV